LTGLDGVRLGDPVELWGAQVPANRVAEACGTIAYELFTGVGARVRRVCECA
jgi:alanine racemase